MAEMTEMQVHEERVMNLVESSSGNPTITPLTKTNAHRAESIILLLLGNFFLIYLSKSSLKHISMTALTQVSTISLSCHYNTHTLPPCHYIIFFARSFVQSFILNLKSFSLIKMYCSCVFLIHI